MSESEEKVETFSVNKSVGGQNAYYHWCDSMGQRRNYGVCMHLLKAYQEGTLIPEEEEGDCANAMRKGNCPAVKMREDELTAGHALYYVPRNVVAVAPSRPVDKSSVGYIIGWNKVPGNKAQDIPTNNLAPPASKAKKPAARKPNKDATIDSGYADMISEMAKESKESGEAIVTAEQGKNSEPLMDKMQRLKELKRKKAEKEKPSEQR